MQATVKLLRLQDFQSLIQYKKAAPALRVRQIADEVAVLRVPRRRLPIAVARVHQLDRAVVRACTTVESFKTRHDEITDSKARTRLRADSRWQVKVQCQFQGSDDVSRMNKYAARVEIMNIAPSQTA